MIKIAESVGVFHSFICDKIKEKYITTYSDNIIDREKLVLMLGVYNVRRELRQRFIKEMEEMRLIRIKNQRKIEIL